MTDPRGLLKARADGVEYSLWFGMSGVAEMQAKHGQDVFLRLDPPHDGDEKWLPDFGIVGDVFMIALQRFHPDLEAGGKYVADSLFRENPLLIRNLLQTAFPDQQAPAPGNRKRPKRAA